MKKLRKLRVTEYAAQVVNSHENLEHKKGYQTYFICVQEPIFKKLGLKMVSGKPIELSDGGLFSYFQHKCDGYWQISEVSTGYKVVGGRTLKAAKLAAQYKIAMQGARTVSYAEVVFSVLRDLQGVVNEVLIEDVPEQDNKSDYQRKLIL